MQALRAVRVERGGLEALEDVEHQEHDHALPVGWALVDLVPAIGRADRLDELAGGGREIVQAVEAAGLVEKSHHARGQLALVERLRPVRRDPPQGAGEHRQAHLLAGGRGVVVGQIEDAARGAVQQALAGPRPVVSDPRRDHEALLGAADRRLQKLVEDPAAVGREQACPGVDGAGHGDAVGAGVEVAHALLAQPLEARRGRRPTGAVERHHAAAGQRQEHEAVAADPGHRRLDHALHGDRRHRGVDRVAAGAQDVERGARGRRMRCRRHAALAVGDGPPRQREVTHAINPLNRDETRILVPRRDVSGKTSRIRTFHPPLRNYSQGPKRSAPRSGSRREPEAGARSRRRRMRDIKLMVKDYRLTTAEILYHMPDHPSLLQTYIWQSVDLAPKFPTLHKFLAFRESSLDGRLHSVKIASAELIKPEPLPLRPRHDAPPLSARFLPRATLARHSRAVPRLGSTPRGPPTSPTSTRSRASSARREKRRARDPAPREHHELAAAGQRQHHRFPGTSRHRWNCRPRRGPGWSGRSPSSWHSGSPASSCSSGAVGDARWPRPAAGAAGRRRPGAS